MSPSSTKGVLTAKFALLAEHHRLRVHEILQLTPKQVDKIYFHPRDKQGAIKCERPVPDAPPEPRTYEQAMMGLDLFYANNAATLHLTRDDYERMKAEMKVKYGQAEAG